MYNIIECIKEYVLERERDKNAYRFQAIEHYSSSGLMSDMSFLITLFKRLFIF